jgi:integrase
LGVNQIMRSVPAPRIKKTPIEPLTQEEVQRMLKACVYSREVRHYAQIAEIDIAQAHHKASPADNWRL